MSRREKLLRVNVAAERLGRTDRTIQRLMRDGKIDYIQESPRKRFIPESALEAFQEQTHIK